MMSIVPVVASKVTVPDWEVKVSLLLQSPPMLMELFSPDLVSRVPPVMVRSLSTSRASSSSKTASPPPSFKVRS